MNRKKIPTKNHMKETLNLVRKNSQLKKTLSFNSVNICYAPSKKW